MRPGFLLASSLALLPSLAQASPYAHLHALQDPAGAASPGTTTTTTTTTTVAPAPTPATDPSLRPTSSKAPPSKDLVDQPAPEPQPVVTPPAPPPEESLAPPPPPPNTWTRHGFGIRGGLTVIPTWAVRGYVQSLTNALCRGNSIPSGNLGKGLTRVDGCNFYIGGEYIYRQSENFDIVPAVAYHRVKAPDGLWLDDSEKDANGNPNLGAADYTQVNFSHVSLQVDFIGRGNLIKTPDFAWQLGGGGGIGLGILTGKGFLQTPLGNPPGSPGGATCTSLEDYKDFTRCTPHYQDEEANGKNATADTHGSLALDTTDPMSNPGRFAKCNKDSCLGSDLDALGRKKGINLPVIPIINILVTTRFMIKDTFGINITGGWQTGFYFGGSLQYFFGNK
ncbi:MAG TPA: hypothetical protein VGB85_29115 [Nannocystis sp.]|jgi:hypothetical protein